MQRARAVDMNRAQLPPAILGTLLCCGCGKTTEDHPLRLEIIREARQSGIERVDVLFVIDNSRDMIDHEPFVTDAIVEVSRAFVEPPCVDDSGRHNGHRAPCAVGRARFPPLPDVHVGVITSSLGAHGGTVCADTPPENDRGRLLPAVRTELSAGGEFDFLAWAPGAEPTQDADAFAARLTAHAGAIGHDGCGFEAPLEAWFRFLIDPEPPSSIQRIGGATVATRGPCVASDNQPNPEADQVICQQRRDFLRPDSFVLIVMIGSENDCSIRDSDVGWYVSTTTDPAGASHTLARPTSACATDPNSPCCRSCAESGPAPPGCPELDPACDGTLLDPSTDKAGLRCWDQERRFGIDFLYPTERYVSALKNTWLCAKRLDLVTGDADGDGAIGSDECEPGTGVLNPLYADLTGSGWSTRGPETISLVGIVGVPWQDLATEATLAASDALELLGSAELGERWDWITGDSTAPPLDPLMRESVEPRLGAHPLGSEFDPAPPDSVANGNPINGHEYLPEYSAAGELQLACTFPLAAPRNCDAEPGWCPCKGVSSQVAAGSYSLANPLCHGTSYSSTQRFGGAWPGLRQLDVLRRTGASSAVGSICPKIGDPTNPEYGYRPAIDAALERFEWHTAGLGGWCLDQPLPVSGDGRVEGCTVVEVTSSGCACDRPGRRPASEALVETILELRDDQCAGASCDFDCFCEIEQHAGAALDACRSHVLGEQVPNGWCALDATAGLGSAQVTQSCGSDQPYMLRFTGVHTPWINSRTWLVCEA